MTQDERLRLLVERFKEDSGRYRDLEVGESEEEQRTALRSLMNIRPPRAMDRETLRLQDEYLRLRAEEKGVVHPEDLPTVREQFGSGDPTADRICLWQGDITRLAADAIVNAANGQMLGCFRPMHNCIDNCIHSYAGVQLRLACEEQMAVLRGQFGPDYERPTAEPIITDGFNLPAGKVIHVVGPVVEYRLTRDLERQLADCYRRVLDLCKEQDLRSVAFCCISTGVFHFPPDRAAEIAVETVSRWLQAHPETPERVLFVVHGDANRVRYEKLLGR